MTRIVAIIDERKVEVVRAALQDSGYDLSLIVSGDFTPAALSGEQRPDLVIVDKYPTRQRGPDRVMSDASLASDNGLQKLIMATIREQGVPFIIAGVFPESDQSIGATVKDGAKGYIPAALPPTPEQASYIREVVAHALG